MGGRGGPWWHENMIYHLVRGSHPDFAITSFVTLGKSLTLGECLYMTREVKRDLRVSVNWLYNC